jgi:hypothetical protein
MAYAWKPQRYGMSACFIIGLHVFLLLNISGTAEQGKVFIPKLKKKLSLRQILILEPKKNTVTSQSLINLLNPKTYFMHHQLNYQKFCVLPYNAFVCFAWISEQTAVISLYSNNLSVFITEAESVYCAVRTGSLNQTQLRF